MVALAVICTRLRFTLIYLSLQLLVVTVNENVGSKFLLTEMKVM